MHIARVTNRIILLCIRMNIQLFSKDAKFYSAILILYLKLQGWQIRTLNHIRAIWLLLCFFMTMYCASTKRKTVHYHLSFIPLWHTYNVHHSNASKIFDIYKAYDNITYTCLDKIIIRGLSNAILSLCYFDSLKKLRM